MRSQSRLPLLTVFFGLVACGRLFIPGQSRADGEMTVQIPSEKVDLYLQGRQVEPPLLADGHRARGVGVLDLLVAPTSAQYSATMSACTATYVEGDVIVNAHCVPPAVRKREVACNTMLFKIAGQKKGIACRKILWTPEGFDSSDTGKGPDLNNYVADITVFSLASKPERIRSLKLSRQPLVDTTDYALWSYRESNPASSPFTFKFFPQTNCRIGSADAAEKFYPFRVINCLIQPENSGSPLMVDSETVQGIASTRLFAPGQRPLGTVVVDLSCLSHVHGQYNWRNECPLKGAIKFDAQ